MTLNSYCSEGNTYFKNKQFSEAIAKYTEAIEADNTDVTFFSNRRSFLPYAFNVF